MQLGIFGHGTLTIPSNHSKLDEILLIDPSDHTNDKASMIRAFIGETHLYDFYVVRMPIKVTEKGSRTAVASGGGPGTALERVKVWNNDYPLLPSVQPDWSYGGANTLLTNPNFEDGIVDEGFEDQDIGSWKALTGNDPWGDEFLPLDTDLSTSTDEAEAGTFSLKIPFGEAPTGVKRSISVVAGERIQISYKFKEPTGSGDRYVIGAEIGDGGIVHHTNGWLFNGIAFAELDAAVRRLGVSDGTWQDFDLDVTIGDDTDRIDIWVQAAIPPDGTFNKPTGYLDTGVFTGLGLGLAPWKPHNTPGGPPLTDMVLDSGTVHEGSWSVKVTGDDEGSIYQDIDGGIPNVVYTVTFWVFHAEGSNKDIQAQHTVPGNNDAFTATITSVPTGVWTEISHTWTETQATGRVEVKNKSGGVITWYTDSTSGSVGQASATFGKIFGELKADADTDHAPARTALLWLVETYDDDDDSDGNAWDGKVPFSISRGQAYRRVIEFHASTHGYEARIKPDSGDYSILNLNLYNPLGMGVDGTTGDAGAITSDGMVGPIDILRREPLATYATVEGDHFWWGENRNTTLETVWGEIEAYAGSEEQKVGALDNLAGNLTTGKEAETIVVKFQDPLLVPGIDYDIGDIRWLILGEDVLPAAKHRIVAIDVKSGDPEPEFQVQFVSEGL